MSWTSIAGALIGPITGLLEKVVPDVDKRAEMAHQIATLADAQAHERLMGQLAINKAEAEHKSVFVAGWRPGLGWAGVIILMNNYILAPYVDAFTRFTIPTLDFGTLMPVIMGMLGLTAARSYEKAKGVAREVSPFG